jgi:hypothetical protein
VESAATPQAARGWARPPYRLKKEAILLLVSAFHTAKPWEVLDSVPTSARVWRAEVTVSVRAPHPRSVSRGSAICRSTANSVANNSLRYLLARRILGNWITCTILNGKARKHEFGWGRGVVCVRAAKLRQQLVIRAVDFSERVQVLL